MLVIKKLFLIDVLKVIPRETRDDLLRIAIDLPESRYSSLVIVTILFQVQVKR